jgi:hypothetical protein
MNYYFDTEFIEGPQNKTILGLKYGQTKPTIDLISIGIVREDKTSDNIEYYAISKDFNLKEAWNRFQMKEVYGDMRNRYPDGVKEYWIRKNVLLPIFIELWHKEDRICIVDEVFTYKNLKRLIAKYGKSNETIAQEVKEFCTIPTMDITEKDFIEGKEAIWTVSKPVFYAYYADYDWVVFCWLFGKMNDLPSGFPMYCRDLKQELDVIRERVTHKGMPVILEDHYKYPKQTNEHNALADARWNLELHKFIKSL